VGIRVLSVCALPETRLFFQGEIMDVTSIPQDDSLKQRLASWFVPPIVVPIMLIALIALSGLYHAYW
jgi:hypothetical protein